MGKMAMGTAKKGKPDRKGGYTSKLRPVNTTSQKITNPNRKLPTGKDGKVKGNMRSKATITRLQMYKQKPIRNRCTPLLQSHPPNQSTQCYLCRFFSGY